MPSLKNFAAALVVLGLALLGPLTELSVAEEKVSWLLIVQGQVKAIDGDRMRIDVPPRVVLFSDRPQRRVRTASSAELVAAWGKDGAFKADPPNASMVREAEDAVSVVEITNATLESDLLELTFRMLKGDRPVVGDHIVLTVDHFCFPVPLPCV